MKTSTATVLTGIFLAGRAGRATAELSFRTDRPAAGFWSWFHNQKYLDDQIIYGQIHSNATAEKDIFSAFQECGPFYLLMPGQNFSQQHVEKLLMVPGTKADIATTTREKDACIQHAVQAYEHRPAPPVPLTPEQMQAQTLAAAQAAAKDQHTRLILTGILVGLFSLTSAASIAWAIQRICASGSVAAAAHRARGSLAALRSQDNATVGETVFAYELTGRETDVER